jgi:hypothetical protein
MGGVSCAKKDEVHHKPISIKVEFDNLLTVNEALIIVKPESARECYINSRLNRDHCACAGAGRII